MSQIVQSHRLPVPVVGGILPKALLGFTKFLRKQLVEIVPRADVFATASKAVDFGARPKVTDAFCSRPCTRSKEYAGTTRFEIENPIGIRGVEI